MYAVVGQTSFRMETRGGTAIKTESVSQVNVLFLSKFPIVFRERGKGYANRMEISVAWKDAEEGPGRT